MLTNPYYKYLKKLFDSLVVLLHNKSLIKDTLTASVRNFSNLEDKEDFILFQALIIGDWTGPHDNGWKINYHTGSDRLIDFDKYKFEVDRLINNEYCHSAAQALERLQEFFKDCISLKMSMNANYCKKCKYEIENNFSFYREQPYRRERLFDYIKKASKDFTNSSKNNNHNIRYKEFWIVLLVIRDAIVHSGSVIKKSPLKKWTKYHYDVLKFLLPKTLRENDFTIIMDSSDCDRIIEKIAEFSFQVFKLISIEDKYNYKVLLNMK